MDSVSVAFLLLAACITTCVCQDVPDPLYKWTGSSNQTSYLHKFPPTTSVNAEYNGMSSCGGGGDNNISWMCPHMMLLSPDMVNAAYQDGNSWAVYGVAGIGQTADCGKCFQLKITGGSNLPVRTNYIVQAVNTGSDVGSGQFDIFLGAGGFGIYDACSSDCKISPRCSGGACNAPMFGGGFNAWTPDGNCYGGGVHDPNGCDKLVTTTYRDQDYAERTLVYGCKSAINQKYHQNFQVNFQQVACPKSLVQLTGIKSKNDDQLYRPNEQLRLTGSGRTTTMMDCCKPTCAWRQNTQDFTEANWPQLFVCDKQGYPLMK